MPPIGSREVLKLRLTTSVLLSLIAPACSFFPKSAREEQTGMKRRNQHTLTWDWMEDDMQGMISTHKKGEVTCREDSEHADQCEQRDDKLGDEKLPQEGLRWLSMIRVAWKLGTQP